MGEVFDENYLKVVVLPDTVTFKLIALNNTVEMKPITWYNIPEKPDSIFGPTSVFHSQSDLNFYIKPIENATNYRWNLSGGISGSSYSSFIKLSFNENFQTGKISVTAFHDGFGESEPEELQVIASNSTYAFEKQNEISFDIQQNQNNLLLKFYSNQPQNAVITFYDIFGRTVYKTAFYVNSGYISKSMENNNFEVKGLVIIELLIGNKRITKKTIIN